MKAATAVRTGRLMDVSERIMRRVGSGDQLRDRSTHPRLGIRKRMFNHAGLLRQHDPVFETALVAGFLSGPAGGESLLLPFPRLGEGVVEVFEEGGFIGEQLLGDFDLDVALAGAFV